MKYTDLVDILDPQDFTIAGQKRRQEVNKQTDCYHSVHVLMITPQGEIVLSGIPSRSDLPNVYARKLGTTIATMRRHNETAEAAAKRALKRELFLDQQTVGILGDQIVKLENGRQILVTAFYAIGEPPQTYSTADIESLKVISAAQFRAALEANPEHFAPTLRHIWQKYYDLPTDLEYEG